MSRLLPPLAAILAAAPSAKPIPPPYSFPSALAMAKSWYKKKSARKAPARPLHRSSPYRHLDSTNWRDRSHLSACDHFSENSIQRQLQYLVVTSPESDRRPGKIREKGCCWHQCEWWVWCCGYTCRDTAGQDVGVEEYGHVRFDGEREGREGEGAAMTEHADDAGADYEGTVYNETEGELARDVKGVRRDEWACDFCGPECFCWTVGGGLLH
jgi:hypothetical protein